MAKTVHEWRVYEASRASGYIRPMEQGLYEANRKVILGDPTSYEVFIDHPNLMMWRWAGDGGVIIYLRPDTEYP